ALRLKNGIVEKIIENQGGIQSIFTRVYVDHYLELQVNTESAKYNFILCHFPFLTWNKSHHKSWSLHGHTHGTLDSLNEFSRRLDVGVDAKHCNYSPISLDEVKILMENKILDSENTHGKHHDQFN
ncbi:MAG: hypothetical protein AABY22_16050, partial [Nanoarchaeota archaeon]